MSDIVLVVLFELVVGHQFERLAPEDDGFLDRESDPLCDDGCINIAATDSSEIASSSP